MSKPVETGVNLGAKNVQRGVLEERGVLGEGGLLRRKLGTKWGLSLPLSWAESTEREFLG
jgi:hypothetical protein